MEHRCEQCGTAVEDGRPFCPQCRAPQLRVQVAIATPDDAAELNRAPDPNLPGLEQGGHFSTPDVLEKKIARSAALRAGLLGVLLGMIPLLGNMLTGALAVFFYRRARGSWPTASSGSRLGGAGGGVAFAISALFTIIEVFVFHAQKESEEALLKFVAAVGADPTSPELQASIQQLFTPSGMALAIILGMMVAVVLAAIGGALAAAVFRSRPGA